MRKILTAFISGCIVGAIVIIALWISSEKTAIKNDSEAILDYVINDWTQTQYITPGIASIPAKIELPDARPGYWPDTVKSLARQIDSLYNIPYAVTLCQFSLESNWGRSNLNLSNYFGLSYNAVKQYMKNPQWAYRRDLVSINGVLMKKQNVAFAEFKDIAECFHVYAQYLKGSARYVKAFETHSPEKFVKELAKGGYAQDKDYALKLITIMRRYKLN